jgi:hypothetical protein
MRKLLLAVCGGVIFVSSASAAEINNTITDSVQLTVNGAGISTQRIGSSYSVSGNNIDVTTLGGLTGGTATAAATMSAGDYALETNGASFNFSEALTVGDTVDVSMDVDATLGTFDTVEVYSDSVITSGGTKGSLAGTLSATGVASVTAGGQGTTALGQRTVTLSVFD